MPIPLYPLRFRPILRRYVWGGRRLESVLGRSLPPGDDYAESWEVCDRKDDQSVIAAGPLAGASLASLVQSRGVELLGRHQGATRFPLLFKLLDAQRALSVQVHPDDRRAAMLSPPDLGKSEAWVVLHADPGSVIYAGMKMGFDRAALEREIHRGTCELCLNRFEPQVGDCIYIPAGAVHALGAGLVIAEIQQSSDVTYRLYDWNRLGTDGRPRPLHIEQGLDAIDFALGPIGPVTPRPTDLPGVERLVDCDKFVLERWRLDDAAALPAENRCRILVAVNGAVSVTGDPTGKPLVRGETMLVPACCEGVLLTPSGPTELLSIHLP